MFGGHPGDPSFARQRREPVDGKDAVYVAVDAGVIVVRVVIGQIGPGEARVDPAKGVVSLDVEGRVGLRPHRGGGEQADQRFLQRLHERRERHAVARELERLLHPHLSLSSASMILSVGGCSAMSWMSM